MMSDTLKNWLPITKRNRVALGFSFAALVMFVTWNCLPYYSMVGEPSDGLVMTQIWPIFFDSDYYLRLIRSPHIDGFLEIAAIMALFLNGVIVLAVVPFWRILHASIFLTAPVALVNFVGGFVILWFLSQLRADSPPPYALAIFTLMALTMFALAAAMLIFKNELGLRHELEVKKTMGRN